MKMDNVRIFEGNEVEVFDLNEQIIFNSRDVGKCLEISADGVRKAITRMNKSQVIKLTNSDVTNCHIRKLKQHLRKLIKVFGSIAEIVSKEKM